MGEAEGRREEIVEPVPKQLDRRTASCRVASPTDHDGAGRPLLAKAVCVFRAPFSWADIPADYDRRIRAMRDELDLTPAQFAERVGAGRKAVVYLMGSTEAVSLAGVLTTDSGARPRRVSVRV